MCLNNPVSFGPGDHFGVFSENADEMVLKVIQKLNPVPSLEQAHRWMIQKEMLTIAGNISQLMLLILLYSVISVF